MGEPLTPAQRAEALSASILNGDLGNPIDTPTPDKAPEPTPEPAKSVPEKPEKPEKPGKKQKPADPVPDDDGAEVDFDAPLDEPEPEDKKVDDVENDDEDPIDKIEDPKERESFARQEAKRRGLEAKSLKAEKTDLELRLAAIEEEKARLAAELETFKAVKVNPREHPEFVSLYEDIVSDVETASEVLTVDDPARVVDNFGVFMREYLALEGLRGAERTAALDKLRAVIVDTVVGGDIPYAEMDPEERRSLNTVATDVLRIVQRNAPKTKKLHELETELKTRASEGSFILNAKEYQEKASRFSKVLDAVGDLPDEVIEAQPESIAAIVAKTVKEIPAAAARLKSAKRDVLDVFVGPRVLSKEEIEKLKANGTDVQKFIKERDKAIAQKQERFAAMAVESAIIRPLLAKALKENAELKAKLGSQNAERDTLDDILKKSLGKATSPAQAPKAVDPDVERFLVRPGKEI